MSETRTTKRITTSSGWDGRGRDPGPGIPLSATARDRILAEEYLRNQGIYRRRATWSRVWPWLAAAVLVLFFAGMAIGFG